MIRKAVVYLICVSASIAAPVPTWGQCGGINYTGSTQCSGNDVCVKLNDYYFQCLPASQVPSTSSTITTSTSVTEPTRQPKTISRTPKTISRSDAPSSASSPAASATVPSAIPGGASGSGVTTRYWDCCKPSCAWPGKANVKSTVKTCAANSNTLVDPNTQSGCNGGSAYMCNDQTPWAINDNLAYGFAATSISGQGESGTCCSCYALTFTSGPVSGKTLIVQSTNTGGDLGNNHFDLALPGGGQGIFSGCFSEFPSTPQSAWGAQYGGVSSASDCNNLPASLQDGCKFRFGWFKGADNPTVSFKQVACPAALTARSGCIRN